MSPRLPQMASLPPPACRFDAAVVKSMMEALLSAIFAAPLRHVAHSMDPDDFHR